MSAVPAVIPQNSNVMPMPGTPMAMLAAAVERGMDAATIKDLMDLQERWEKNQAQKAYNEAFSAFKAEAVNVIKNKSVTAGPLTGKSYAELFSVVDAVTPALSKHGLSASWKVTKDEKDWIEVTCYLKHMLGHCETASLGGPPDVGGAKNPIQARASTVTYLERYTLKLVCGVAERGDDADGNAQKQKRLTEAEIADWGKAIEATATKEEAKVKIGEAAKACEAIGDTGAYELIKETYRAHLKGLK